MLGLGRLGAVCGVALPRRRAGRRLGRAPCSRPQGAPTRPLGLVQSFPGGCGPLAYRGSVRFGEALAELLVRARHVDAVEVEPRQPDLGVGQPVALHAHRLACLGHHPCAAATYEALSPSVTGRRSTLAEEDHLALVFAVAGLAAEALGCHGREVPALEEDVGEQRGVAVGADLHLAHRVVEVPRRPVEAVLPRQPDVRRELVEGHPAHSRSSSVRRADTSRSWSP